MFRVYKVFLTCFNNFYIFLPFLDHFRGICERMRVEQAVTFKCLREEFKKGKRNISSHRMTNQEDFSNMQIIKQYFDSSCHKFHRMAFTVNFGESMAREIDGDDTELRGEFFCKSFPYIRCF